MPIVMAWTLNAAAKSGSMRTPPVENVLNTGVSPTPGGPGGTQLAGVPQSVPLLPQVKSEAAGRRDDQSNECKYN